MRLRGRGPAPGDTGVHAVSGVGALDPHAGKMQGRAPRPAALLSLAARLLLLALLWWVIAGSEPNSWLIGIPAVLMAGYYGQRLAAPERSGPSVVGFLTFAPFFLWQSLLGGLDVARRVLPRRMRIAPGFQRYEVRLKNPAARVFFLDSISLLPGTLSADLRGGIIEVHALDARNDLAPELADLERRVGRLFGEPLTKPSLEHGGDA